MLAHDHDELICDLAETYQIYDFKQLPPPQVAVFAIGLRDSSRVKMKRAGIRLSLDQILEASMLDSLNGLRWMLSENGAKRRDKPEQILLKLLGKDQENKKDKPMTFNTPEEFEKYREMIIERMEHGRSR